MRNVLAIDGYKAVLAFDSDIGLFRGEFLGLNGGADFYAASMDGLVAEGRASLQAFTALCRQKGVELTQEAN